MALKNTFLPVFNEQPASTSAMHRIFGDFVPSTGISKQDNILSPAMLSKNGIEVRLRVWFWKPTYAPLGTVTTRFECYANGILCDYTTDRKAIVRTFRWFIKMGERETISERSERDTFSAMQEGRED
jgi:hypothetical protein